MSEFSFTHERKDSGLSKIIDISSITIDDISPVFDYSDEIDVRSKLIELEKFYRDEHDKLRVKFESFTKPFLDKGYTERTITNQQKEIVCDDYDYFRKELCVVRNNRHIKMSYTITPEVTDKPSELIREFFSIEDCTDEYRVDLMTYGRKQIFHDDRLPVRNEVVYGIINNYLARFQ